MMRHPFMRAYLRTGNRWWLVAWLACYHPAIVARSTWRVVIRSNRRESTNP